MTTTLLLPAAVVGVVTLLAILFQPIYAQQAPLTSLFHAARSQDGPAPPPTTFANYEDLNSYIADRVDRRLRRLDNPTDDSYVEAFNQRTEQEGRSRQKRRALQRKLPSEPRLLQFDIADAVEPNEETRKVIQGQIAREIRLAATAATKTAATTPAKSVATTAAAKTTAATTTAVSSTNNNKKSKPLRKSMRLSNGPDFGQRVRVGRTKRDAARNLQVQLIPFEASDAREPDEETRKLIKRMRTLELEKLERTQATDFAPPVLRLPRVTPTTPTILPKPSTIAPSGLPSVSPTLPPQLGRRSKAGKIYAKTPRKRTRRAIVPPNEAAMIKFELEDAKEPDESLKTLMSLSRESDEVKANSLQEAENQNASRKLDSVESGAESDDQNSDESRRLFFYKDAPVKVKKSINSLPQEVQKAISHLIKDGQRPSTNINHLHPPQMDYSQLRSSPHADVSNAAPSSYQIQKGAAAGAYGPAAQPSQNKVQLQIESVPVVEDVRYIYSPAPMQQHLIAAPIVVPEAGYAKQVAPQLTEVHHTYTADLSDVQQQSEAKIKRAQQSSSQQFHASQQDPYLESNNVGVGASENQLQSHQAQQQQQPVADNYKYDLFSGFVAEYGGNGNQGGAKQPPAAEGSAVVQPASPLIKIEYHAAPDPLKQNYKELAEFKELSQLMGKSPDDQFHGLTYLLAKEMQSKMKAKRQQKALLDNTSPVLFDPPEYGALGAKVPLAAAEDAEEASVFAQPGRLIGMGKSKQYIPVIEQPDAKAAAASGAEALQQQQALFYEDLGQGKQFAAKPMPQIPQPSSFVHYGQAAALAGGPKAQPQPLAAALQGAQHAGAQNSQGLDDPGSHYVQGFQGKQQQAQYGYGGFGAGGGGGGGHVSASQGLGGAAVNSYGVNLKGNSQNLYSYGSLPGGGGHVLANQGLGGAAGNSYGKNLQGNAQNLYSSGGLLGGGGGHLSASHGFGGGSGNSYAKNLQANPQIGVAAGAAAPSKLQVGLDAAKLDGSLNFRTLIDERDSLQYASKYAFGYRIRDFNSGNDFGHKQNRDVDGVTRGQYHVLLPDGRIQNVIYHADNTGFHADVSFESGH